MRAAMNRAHTTVPVPRLPPAVEPGPRVCAVGLLETAQVAVERPAAANPPGSHPTGGGCLARRIESRSSCPSSVLSPKREPKLFHTRPFRFKDKHLGQVINAVVRKIH